MQGRSDIHMFDINTKLNDEEILIRRTKISELLASPSICDGTVKALSVVDLEQLFKLYDRFFFENWFQEFYKGRMKFSVSRRMTKSAGLTICPKNMDRMMPEQLTIEIRIGVDFFLRYGQISGNKTVCGLKTKNSLEALQLVFEHELCHVIEFLYFKRSSCKGKRFKTIAGNLFGHSESYHRLPTQRQIARQKLGLKIGDKVSFTHEGRNLSGFIYNIHKRATVMVKNDRGTLVDSRGNRYIKYYVPLTLLKR
ncbi:MAG TPA: hypothetical protein DD738_03930 [Ruminiclostridium sp.]|nr:hypothetical protein [Ruminiclostridium sp.]